MSNKDLEAPVATEERKPAPPPHRLKSRVRIMGKWRDKSYRPSKAEEAEWRAKCKRFNLDLRTGAPKVAKEPEPKKK